MIRPKSAQRWIVYAFVECRNRGGPWWLFARPTLEEDARMASLLTGIGPDADDAEIVAHGVPHDASLDVRDEYSWRVAGRYAGEGANIVGADDAARWLATNAAQRWDTQEAFTRVTDPRWEHPTWMDATELSHVLDLYERSGEAAPSTYCALLSMMEELERDYSVRLILWVERVVQMEGMTSRGPLPMHRDHRLALAKANRRIMELSARVAAARPRTGEGPDDTE